MPEPAYSFRASLRSPEMSYRLAGEGLEWSGGSGMGQLPYAEIRQIRRYQSPGMWFVQSGATIPGFTRCVVRPRHGPTQVLSSNHFIGLGAFEDRSATFEPFGAGRPPPRRRSVLRVPHRHAGAVVVVVVDSIPVNGVDRRVRRGGGDRRRHPRPGRADRRHRRRFDGPSHRRRRASVAVAHAHPQPEPTLFPRPPADG